MSQIQKIFWLGILLVSAAATLWPARATAAENAATAPTVPTTAKSAPISRWHTFINATDLYVRFPDRNLLIIDVREPEEFSQGHIPEAINIPSGMWRDTVALPGGGTARQLFRKDDGSLDVTQYEKLFSQWGIRNDHRIVIYGSFGGKQDGSVPVGIMQLLGHQHVAFLDGIGTDQWLQAGHSLTFFQPKPLPPSHYIARAKGHLWTYKDVIDNLKEPDVVFLDVRTIGEFTGKSMLDNKRGGHIPGARHLSVDALLDRVNRTTLSPQKTWPGIADLKLPSSRDSMIVIYAQTDARALYGMLILRDLGYNNIGIYDQGWQEFGNRDDSPIETGAPKIPVK